MSQSSEDALPKFSFQVPEQNCDGWGPLEVESDFVIQPFTDLPFNMYSKREQFKGALDWGGFNAHAKKGSGTHTQASDKDGFKLVATAKTVQPQKQQIRRNNQYIKKDRLTDKEWFEKQYGHLSNEMQMSIKKEHNRLAKAGRR